MLELSREGHIHIITLRDGENRFRLDSLARWNEALSQVVSEVGDGPGALIVVGEGKYWSNGIDLTWLSSADNSDAAQFVPVLNDFLARMLTLPVPTVAALNGHTFAAGALLALAMDYRVMRSDRGWFCLPEVDIQIPFHPAMMALLECKLPPTTLRDVCLRGGRYVADDALAAGIVDKVCPQEQLLSQAQSLAAPLAEKGRNIFGRMKSDLYGRVARLLAADLADQRR